MQLLASGVCILKTILLCWHSYSLSITTENIAVCAVITIVIPVDVTVVL